MKVSHKVLIGGLLLLGFFLRVHLLGNNSYTGDEARVITLCSGTNLLWQDVHPPLYRVFLAGWVRLFGTSETTTKMLSVIFGTLALWLIYLIGKELGGKRVGLCALYLGAISPFLILFSRTARSFPCFLFFNLGSIWLFLLAIKNTNKLWIYILVTILDLYAGTFAVFTLLCEWIWLIINSKKIDKKKWAISQLIILLAASFWFIRLFKLALPIETAFSVLDRVPASLPAKLGYLGFSFSLGQTTLPWNLKLVVPGIFIYTMLAIYGLRILIKKRWSKEIAFLGIFILVPVIPICTNLNFPHYYLGVASLYYILLGIGIAFMRMRAMIPILILIAGVNAYGIKNIYNNREYHLQRFTDNWREISTIVTGFSDPDTKVIAYHQAFIWYYNLPNLVALDARNPEKSQEELIETKKIIFVHTHLSGICSSDDQKIREFKEWLDRNFSCVQSIGFFENEDYEIKRKFLKRSFPRFRVQVFLYERGEIL